MYNQTCFRQAWGVSADNSVTMSAGNTVPFFYDVWEVVTVALYEGTEKTPPGQIGSKDSRMSSSQRHDKTVVTLPTVAQILFRVSQRVRRRLRLFLGLPVKAFESILSLFLWDFWRNHCGALAITVSNTRIVLWCCGTLRHTTKCELHVFKLSPEGTRPKHRAHYKKAFF